MTWTKRRPCPETSTGAPSPDTSKVCAIPSEGQRRGRPSSWTCDARHVICAGADQKCIYNTRVPQFHPRRARQSSQLLDCLLTVFSVDPVFSWPTNWHRLLKAEGRGSLSRPVPPIFILHKKSLSPASVFSPLPQNSQRKKSTYHRAIKNLKTKKSFFHRSEFCFFKKQNSERCCSRRC